MADIEIDNHYAPNWLTFFNEDGDLLGDVRLQVECHICDKYLAIIEPPDDEHEAYCIFPCGHAFGHECASRWIDNNPTCPTCRRSLQFRGCSHRVSIEPLQPVDGFNIHRDLPLILNRDEELPEMCSRCDRRSALRAEAHEEAREFTYPYRTILRNHASSVARSGCHYGGPSSCRYCRDLGDFGRAPLMPLDASHSGNSSDASYSGNSSDASYSGDYSDASYSGDYSDDYSDASYSSDSSDAAHRSREHYSDAYYAYYSNEPSDAVHPSREQLQWAVTEYVIQRLREEGYGSEERWRTFWTSSQPIRNGRLPSLDAETQQAAERVIRDAILYIEDRNQPPRRRHRRNHSNSRRH
ncbi:hypothetical protein F4779DRAFT_621362 [Xylariaceae sp. FL0662B]|nr:hypothetical protein F4779DRAFT_621362 [Xylariaceae sp. FL0662B]